MSIQSNQNWNHTADIVVVGSGNTQGAVKQSFPVYEPRTHLTSGSYSPMGWAVPAAMGAKLACPDKKVVAIVGDGDFMMSLPEMGTDVMNGINVVFLVLNNQGYMSIRGGMRKFMGATTLAFLSVDGIYRAVGHDGRDAFAPQFTDHCFTGHYPTQLVDQNGDNGNAPRQLSLLVEVG